MRSDLGASGYADRALRGFRRYAAASRPSNPLRTNRLTLTRKGRHSSAPPVGLVHGEAGFGGTPSYRNPTTRSTIRVLFGANPLRTNRMRYAKVPP
jgi:hypothetical protein